MISWVTLLWTSIVLNGVGGLMWYWLWMEAQAPWWKWVAYLSAAVIAYFLIQYLKSINYDG